MWRRKGKREGGWDRKEGGEEREEKGKRRGNFAKSSAYGARRPADQCQGPRPVQCQGPPRPAVAKDGRDMTYASVSLCRSVLVDPPVLQPSTAVAVSPTDASITDNPSYEVSRVKQTCFTFLIVSSY